MPPRSKPAIGNRSTNGSLLDYLEASGTTAFLVVHDDEVVYERYFDGYDERSIQTSFSMAKSFASALVGIAIDDEPITNYIPELLERDKRFGSITIGHLLTMSSGIKYEEGGDLPWSEEADDTKTYYATNLRELALENCRIEGEPAEYFEYDNYNPLLVGMILERATGIPVARYMEQELWKPMGMGVISSSPGGGLRSPRARTRAQIPPSITSTSGGSTRPKVKLPTSRRAASTGSTST